MVLRKNRPKDKRRVTQLLCVAVSFSGSNRTTSLNNLQSRQTFLSLSMRMCPTWGRLRVSYNVRAKRAFWLTNQKVCVIIFVGGRRLVCNARQFCRAASAGCRCSRRVTVFSPRSFSSGFFFARCRVLDKTYSPSPVSPKGESGGSV